MHQWWQFKCENMDTVLFFKVGKFYELFHMDSDIGMTELDLIYMKGTKAHSGFPEVAYGKQAAALVAKGYRVARIEQTETPDMLKERNDKQGKKDKVVTREVCSVMSKGTRTYCHLDDLTLLEEGNQTQSASILVTISEKLVGSEEEQGNPIPEYGVCIIDTVIGSIVLAQFQDDYLRSRLRTLMAKYIPSEVLLESGNHSPETRGVVRIVAPLATVDTLRSGSEMPTDAQAVMQQITTSKYFSDDKPWPAVLQAVKDGSADGSSALVACAFGGALWQLRRSLIDYEIISMGKVFAYVPPDNNSQSDDEVAVPVTVEGENPVRQSSSQQHNLFDDASLPATDFGATSDLFSEDQAAATASPAGAGTIPLDQLPTYMTLDAIALGNLEILVNNYDKTEKGSLFAFVNRCKTAPGARLLKDWLVKPLFRPRDIARRAAAVDELLTRHIQKVETMQQTVLKGLPDLERLLSRVHSNGIKKTGNVVHPNTRAIMFDAPVYTAKKIRDFADILCGFEKLLKIGDIFKGTSLNSDLLKKILKPTEEQGKFPFTEMSKILHHFREIFDEKQAKKDGFIRPKPGVNSDYDDAKQDVARLEGTFETYLRDMKKLTGISDLNYWGSNKDRYQIEVPMSQSAKVPKDWASKSQKKTHRRYWTPVIEKTLQQLVAAEERAVQSQTDTLRSIFEKFDRSSALWSNAVSCVSMLDALFSLTVVSSAPNYVWPEVVHPDSIAGPSIDIQGGRHPMLEHTFALRYTNFSVVCGFVLIVCMVLFAEMKVTTFLIV
jgi:DNA mismatch repair protein MSH6